MKSLIVSKLPRSKQKGKGVTTYCDILDKITKYSKAHQFVSDMMSAYDNLSEKPDRSIHGRFFELIIGETLARKGVLYLYYQAEIRQVPLAIFDWFLYHEISPVTVSCKTKSRDRWKQAAYEAMALKRVYSQAVNYLVTIEKVTDIENKKKLAPQTIDYFVVASNPEYDDALEEITSKVYCQAVKTSPIVNGCLLDIGKRK